jgi:serine protease Do
MMNVMHGQTRLVACRLSFILSQWTLILAMLTPVLRADDGPSPTATIGAASARLLSNAFREAAEKALPTVVTILGQVENKEQPILNVIGGSESQKYASMGSGVIISPDGLILTNHHVIADTSHVDVRLYDGHMYVAEEIKSDPASDLAILRIKSDDPFPASTLGDSDELHVGDWVLAIGSPFQLEASVSAGIISRTERFQRLSQDVQGRFLQTDAAINPGNSGGPLLDLDGQVIGINTAITSRSGGFQGVGFAIPITRAKWIRKELEEHGRVRRAQMGVRANPVPPDVADQLKLARGMGVQVESVVYNRAGQKAGLKPRDVILRLGNEQVTATNFSEVVQRSPIDEPIKMLIARDGNEMELNVELEARQ